MILHSERLASIPRTDLAVLAMAAGEHTAAPARHVRRGPLVRLRLCIERCGLVANVARGRSLTRSNILHRFPTLTPHMITVPPEAIA